ncbi:MAG: right-handed parallel beta-helix repeat-containing protein [Pirellulales bacterium]|nr:right-handed parallel beta-helix repeat-containing protein [Pirellulales bacterium]
MGDLARAADVTLSGNGQLIKSSAQIAPGEYTLADASGHGAIQIVGDDLVVDFQGATLNGATGNTPPNEYQGHGVILRGKNITLRNAKIHGYKAAVVAINCPGLTLENLDVGGNWQQRLRSTPAAEDGGDWLFAHDNPDDRWLRDFGAGVYLRDCDRAVIRRVTARHGQNGIVLVNVSNSKIYDNDCSFLSGWGLAMWKCNDNLISRNSLDFCIRGYSHGIYNRGQDSAGILLFEQNNRNIIIENSATHGGDGLFGFAGKEALGETPVPPDFDFKRRGCNDNLIMNNDFSYASAHGIEMTFSFGNQYVGNRVVENAICGLWGGYSQDSYIAANDFHGNGEFGYGLERGGVNIDSGKNNLIVRNRFEKNKAGVHLWGPANPDFLKKPWGQANQPASTGNVIAHNSFDGDDLAIQLRGETRTGVGHNTFKNVKREIDAGDQSKVEEPPEVPQIKIAAEPLGETRPVGARAKLRGRDKILMTEWGPYDHMRPMIFPTNGVGSATLDLQLLGTTGEFAVKSHTGQVRLSATQGTVPGKLTVQATEPGVHPFTVTIDINGQELTAVGTLVWTTWDVKFFQWTADPRHDLPAWRALIAGKPISEQQIDRVNYSWGAGTLGPNLPGDRFGTVATTKIDLPAGTYLLKTVSDDGIRVWVDEKLVIDDWTWHVPTAHDQEITLENGEHTVRVEHFEIDGVAQLQVGLEPVEK